MIGIRRSNSGISTGKFIEQQFKEKNKEENQINHRKDKSAKR